VIIGLRSDSVRACLGQAGQPDCRNVVSGTRLKRLPAPPTCRNQSPPEEETMFRPLRLHLRHLLFAVPLGAALLVLCVAPASAEGRSANLDCTITFTSDINPPITPAGGPHSSTTEGLTGTAGCAGTVDGQAVSGTGSFGLYSEGTGDCVSGSGSGIRPADPGHRRDRDGDRKVRLRLRPWDRRLSLHRRSHRHWHDHRGRGGLRNHPTEPGHRSVRRTRLRLINGQAARFRRWRVQGRASQGLASFLADHPP